MRAQYLQDWIVDPQFPLVWRLRREVAGSGALGDIGAHIVDAAQFVTGETITGVSAVTETFVKQRPLLSATSGGLAATGSAEQGTGEVTVDDAAIFTARLTGGMLGVVRGHPLRHRAQERDPARGQRQRGQPRLRLRGDERAAGARRVAPTPTWRDGPAIQVTESTHPYMAAWWPPGHLIGYEHTFTHEVVDLLNDIATGADPTPSFADGLQVQRVLAAVEASAASSSPLDPRRPRSGRPSQDGAAAPTLTRS